MEQLTELAQYGGIGVAIALIALMAFFGRLIYKLAANHLRHNTDSNNELRETFKELCIYLKSLNGRLRK